VTRNKVADTEIPFKVNLSIVQTVKLQHNLFTFESSLSLSCP